MIWTSLWPSRNGHALVEDLGFLVHEPEEEYRANSNQYLDSEQLGDFRQDAFLFHKRQQGIVPQSVSHDAEVERAILMRILCGQDHYQSQYAIGDPINPRTGQPYNRYSKEYEKWAAQQTKPVITAEQAQLIEHIAFGYRAHDHAQELLSEGVAQRIVRSQYRGVPCQARIDWLNPKRGIVGVMIADSFTYLESHLRYNGTTNDLAFQRALLAQAVGKKVPVYLIALEKRLPHRCGVWTISERLLRRAQKVNEKAISQLEMCRRLNRWPTGFEGIRKLAPVGI